MFKYCMIFFGGPRWYNRLLHTYIAGSEPLANPFIFRRFVPETKQLHIMKTKTLAGFSAALAVICSTVFIPVFQGCSSFKKSYIAEEISDDGLLLNDDLVAYRTEDGKVSIKNSTTGAVTIKDIKLDWTQRSGNDTLAVFCSEGKRGFYNLYTGEIAVPAQFRRAWVFREGLAAVQRNGNIGFINHKGETVIDFKFPYHGNPLTEFVFKDGHCVVADTTGKCGVIDKAGKWLIGPEYDYVSAYKEYAIVTKAGLTRQMGYDGSIINAFVLDHLKELTYTEEERYLNASGDISYAEQHEAYEKFAEDRPLCLLRGREIRSDGCKLQAPDRASLQEHLRRQRQHLPSVAA